MHALIGLFLFGMGILNIVAPEAGWHLSEGWKFKDAEPSDEALIWIRISGVICILVSIWMVFFTF